jgi:chemotaxis protein methyltransferase WspC
MKVTPIIELLEQRIGLDHEALGPSVLPMAIAERMRAVGVTDPTVYAVLLEQRPEEFATLADQLVVPETWFFRGSGLFEELTRQVAAGLPVDRPFRALCLPCSTGEEPYTLAIALVDGGIPGDRWMIDAIDLSSRHIELARRGVYRDFSFRENHPGLRERYFHASADGWQLDDCIRQRVTFRLGNLIDPELANEAAGTYDLILCRNLLIYLTPAARQLALNSLERILTATGLLAVGHAEPQALADRAFYRVGPESLFLFRRGPISAAAPIAHSPRLQPRLTIEAPTPPAVRTSAPAPKAVPSESLLVGARRYADAGQLEDALRACYAHIHAVGPSAEAYSLLGMIQQARGDTTATADAFRRTLYLDPDNRDALTYTMLHATRQGETSRAEELRSRLARTKTEDHS